MTLDIPDYFHELDQDEKVKTLQSRNTNQQLRSEIDDIINSDTTPTHPSNVTGEWMAKVLIGLLE